MSRATILLAAALLGLAALTACEPAPPPDTYVALGDSAASGPLVPGQITEAGGCLRSDHNYAHLVAPQIHTTRFIDVTCGSATTENLENPQTSLFDGVEHPPQLDVLDARTKVVTITMGGNDVGFGGIVTDCIALMAQFQTCNQKWSTSNPDAISARITALGPKLDRAFAEIKRRAPQAQVFLVPYIPMLPAGDGCAPLSPLPGDVAWMRARFDEFRDMLRSRARANGVHFVDAVANATGHDMCQPAGTRWIEGLVPLSPAAPFHPNADGYAGIAPMIAAAINAAVPA